MNRRLIPLTESLATALPQFDADAGRSDGRCQVGSRDCRWHLSGTGESFWLALDTAWPARLRLPLHGLQDAHQWPWLLKAIRRSPGEEVLLRAEVNLVGRDTDRDAVAMLLEVISRISVFERASTLMVSDQGASCCPADLLQVVEDALGVKLEKRAGGDSVRVARDNGPLLELRGESQALVVELPLARVVGAPSERARAALADLLLVANSGAYGCRTRLHIDSEVLEGWIESRVLWANLSPLAVRNTVDGVVTAAKGLSVAFQALCESETLADAYVTVVLGAATQAA